MKQAFVQLTGGQQYATSCPTDAFTILSGNVYVYVFYLEDGEPSRRFFLCELKTGDQIPALSYQEDGGLWWQFALLAENTARLSREEGGNTPQLMADILKKGSMPVAPGVTPEEALAEFYRLRLVREEGDIYSAAQEQRSVFEEGLWRIATIFGQRKVRMTVKTGRPLYDALALICHYQKIRIVNHDTLLESRGNRYTPQDIADLSGFLCREVVLEEGWFRRDMGALLVYDVDTNAPLVCLPNSSHSYYLYDPETNKKRRLTSKVARQVKAQAWLICAPLEDKEIGMWDLLKHLCRKIHIADLVAFLVMFLFVTLVGLLIPYLNEQLYDLYIPMANSSGLQDFCFLMLSTVGGMLCFSIVKNFALYRLESSSKYNLQSALFDRLFRLPQHFLDRFDSAQLALYAMGLSNVVSALYNAVLLSVVGVLFSALPLYRMFSYNEEFSKRALWVLAIAMVIMVGLNLLQLKKEKIVIEKEAESSSRIFQLLNGIAKIRIAGAENRALLEYLKPYIVLERAKRDKEHLSLFVNSLILVFPTIFSLVLYYQLITDGETFSMGSLMAFQTSFSAFSTAFLTMMQSFFASNNAIPAFEKLKPILHELPEVIPGMNLPGKITGDIEVNNLSFCYEGNDQMVLNDLSFHIRSGEYIGIVGSSGCGKSTLLKLLLGFERPKIGKIYYDGRDIDVVDKRELRKKLGVVLQNGKLISASILENITITAKNVRLNAVNDVLRKVGMRDDIEQMPMGLQTPVNEEGSTVSGGQRQRLLIARALISNPAVLYLDEATSALDNVTQRMVCDTLEEMNCTRVVIAHRLSTVIRCDRIFVIDQGNLAEEGSYAELMAKDGLFAKLARRQLI